MDFPYGKAPLSILILALLSGAALVAVAAVSRKEAKPDLVFATFVKEQAEAYRPAMDQFEKDYHVKIQVQVVNQDAMNDRLQASLQAGADVPDLCEIMYGTIGTFTKGPLEDVGFLDLTDRLKKEGLARTQKQPTGNLVEPRAFVCAAARCASVHAGLSA